MHNLPGSGDDHVAILLRLKVEAFSYTAYFFQAPAAFPMDKFPDLDEESKHDFFVCANKDLINEFAVACTSKEIDKADRIWHQMAEQYIKIVFKWAEVGLVKTRGGEKRRGNLPTFEEKRIVSTSSEKVASGAECARLKSWVKLCNRGEELSKQVPYLNIPILTDKDRQRRQQQAVCIWNNFRRAFTQLIGNAPIAKYKAYNIPSIKDIMGLITKVKDAMHEFVGKRMRANK